MHCGKLGDIDLAWIGNDKFYSTLENSLADSRAEDRVLFSCV